MSAQKLSKDQVIALARLAQLELSDEEVAQYQRELSAILEYVEQLEQEDTKGLQPTSQVTGLVNVMRRDEVAPSPASRDDLMAGAPQTQDDYVKVGRMI